MIPDSVLAASIEHPFAYLSSSINATTKSVAAVQISSTFLVTNVDWVDDKDREQIKWTLFEDDKIPVKKVWVDSDSSIGSRPLYSIAMIELERKGSKARLLPSSTTLDLGASLQLSSLDPALLQSSLSRDSDAFVAPVVSCGLSEASDADADMQLDCLQFKPQVVNSSVLVRMGIVMCDGKLAGLTFGHHRLNEGATTVRFLSLAQSSRSSFLYRVYSELLQTGEVSPLESRYRTSAARFFEGDVLLDLGGVVIAPDAVLTTASSALAYNFSHVFLRTDVSYERQEVQRTVVHTLYKSESSRESPSRYDFAILKLERSFSGSTVAAFSSTDSSIGSEAVRVDLSEFSGVESARFSIRQCVDVAFLAFKSSELYVGVQWSHLRWGCDTAVRQCRAVQYGERY